MRVSMSPKSALAAAAVIVTLGCAAPAAATVTIYTYTGTIQYGYDETGVFGTAGRDLAGLAFTATFRRDDTSPAEQSQTAFVSETYTINGDPESRPILASLTIAGGGPITFGQAYGQQHQEDVGRSEFFSHSALDYGDDGEGFFEDRWLSMAVSGEKGDYLPSADYRDLPSLTAAATPRFYWLGDVRVDDYLYDVDTGEVLSRSRANAFFAPTALTVTIAVPEPATWALMLTGFFGAGAALRSRRRTVADTRQPAR